MNYNFIVKKTNDEEKAIVRSTNNRIVVEIVENPLWNVSTSDIKLSDPNIIACVFRYQEGVKVVVEEHSLIPFTKEYHKLFDETSRKTDEDVYLVNMDAIYF